MSNTFLEVRNIVKTFGGVTALNGVSMHIDEGEVLCLAGENGCGKSTLIKVISGAHEADSGEIYIQGRKYAHMTPQLAMECGIQVIYQDFSIFPNLSVAENIAMNHQVQAHRKFANWKDINRIAQEAMDNIGFHIDPALPVERLSVASKQVVAICRALLDNAKLIIMDEPTTALTAKEVDRLFEIIVKLKAKGIAVVIVNHKIEEVYNIAERLVILRNGANVAEGPIHEFDKKRFIECLTGRELEIRIYNPVPSDEVIFRTKDLRRKDSFEGVSFEMHRGDILGITGLLGSGRGEIGEALFGISPPDGGEIEIEGRRIEICNPRDAIRNGIAYVPEDRLTQGLFFDQSIGMNIVIAAIQKYRRGFILNHKEMGESMEHWIRELSVTTPSAEPFIQTLSGGNQQKVVLAKWLNNSPKLLILNGPTVGVDIGAKTDIHRILQKLASEGIGIIIISDDLPELVRNCNSVIVMKHGRISNVLSAKEIDEDRLDKALRSE